MKVGFRADNDLDRDIVRGLLRLEPNIDFEAEPLNGLDDEAVLLIALREDRILCRRSRPRLPSGLLRYGAPSGGHDDTVMALAMAWSVVSGQIGIIRGSGPIES